MIPIKILAIDDEPDTLELLSLKFTEEVRSGQFEFLYASNGEEGLSRLIEKHFDLALVDLRMPLMDGLEFLKRAQELFPNLLCIVVSAFDDMKNLRQAMNYGAFDFVCKPIQFEDLHQTILKAQRSIEKQEVARRTKESLLSVMNHELRTPLNGVIGMADYIATQVSDPFLYESLEVIRDSGNSLLDVFNDILFYSSSAYPETIRSDEQLILSAFLKSLVNLYQPVARLKHIALELKIIGTLPPLVVGDRVHLSQVLTHLLSNAIKFSVSSTEVVLTCEAKKRSAEQVWLRFEVIDQGVGIAPEVQEKIFEPFFQIDDSLTRAVGGLGLGLAIAKLWIERLGGSIGLQSELGQGSRFWIEVPFQTPHLFSGNGESASSSQGKNI
ncbi:MAG: ATP-binding protein [bacterium]|nr:ATP-binding protein [bacterium]